MSPVLAARRLHSAETELQDALREGRARDAAAWLIAVEVLRHYAGADAGAAAFAGAYPSGPQASVRS